MAMWDVDLTTRMGANTATRMGGIAAFVLAGLGVAGALVYVFGVLNTDPAQVAGFVVGGLTEAVIGIVAGFRLRAGKGLVWGGLALVLAGLELIGKVVELHLGGLFIGAAVTVYLFNGVRGAYVLRQGRFAEDEAEVFG